MRTHGLDAGRGVLLEIDPVARGHGLSRLCIGWLRLNDLDGLVWKICAVPLRHCVPPVGASLLTEAIYQSMKIVDVPASSRAGSLPQWIAHAAPQAIKHPA
jgi:hypothetical protein